MRLILALALGSVLLNSGCMTELLSADMPLRVARPAGDPIDSAGGAKLAGVYSVVQGEDIFGSKLVALWVRGELCLYSGSEVIFVETAGSMAADTSARFNGYYRFVRSAMTGSISLTILPDEGGRSVGAGLRNRDSATFTIRGTFDNPNGDGSRDIVLVRTRALDTAKFYIMGNCAGGRNSERLGRSENSLEMTRFSEYLGCNAVEVDLHVTQDDTVILMHDDQFSPRTVETTYILGDVSSFTLRQIRRNSRLIHGEVLPTLSEFLTFVIDSTNLQLVWLDPKVSRGVDKALEAQKNAIDYARRKGRSLRIIFGLPSPEILDAFRRAPLADSVEALYELLPENLASIKSCRAWGPRWTRGTQGATVAGLQNGPHHYWVFPWTIDSPDYMTQFLNDAHYDGILSNYPSMLTGLYYAR